tara:strand:- start:165 stop:560 length:396 start_codon:yes stop_codon:yes gene_type:complete
MISVEKYDAERHYETLLGWWLSHGEVEEPREILSPHGGVVSDDDGPILACFAYLCSGCPVAFFDRMVGRPEATAASIREAGAVLQDYLRELANGLGYNYLYLHAPHRALVREYEHQGWHRLMENTLMGMTI